MGILLDYHRELFQKNPSGAAELARLNEIHLERESEIDALLEMADLTKDRKKKKQIMRAVKQARDEYYKKEKEK